MARWSAWKKEAPIAGNLSTLKRITFSPCHLKSSRMDSTSRRVDRIAHIYARG
jgi:hypothetical protein